MCDAHTSVSLPKSHQPTVIFPLLLPPKFWCMWQSAPPSASTSSGLVLRIHTRVPFICPHISASPSACFLNVPRTQMQHLDALAKILIVVVMSPSPSPSPSTTLMTAKSIPANNYNALVFRVFDGLNRQSDSTLASGRTQHCKQVKWGIASHCCTAATPSYIHSLNKGIHCNLKLDLRISASLGDSQWWKSCR